MWRKVTVFDSKALILTKLFLIRAVYFHRQESPFTLFLILLSETAVIPR